MSSKNSTEYKIKLTKSFKTAYKKFTKIHYKKDAKGKQAFDDLIKDYVRLLSIDPKPPDENAKMFSQSINKIRREPFNSQVFLEHWDFRKLYFTCPRLQGASALGRIMYVIDESISTVFLMTVYNHQQYAKRPPDAVLKAMFQSLKHDEYER